MKLNFKGKTAVITGASGGMGLEMSKKLSQNNISVLMLDLKTNIKKFYSEFFFINLIIVIFLFSFLFLIMDNFTKNDYINNFLFNLNINWFNKIECMTDLNALGQILYTHYLVQFLILGMILLLAVIGSVALTFNRNKKNFILYQCIFRQVSR
jgi:NADH:ubiquinone oxidoreductase subunit 6 (subunit J)